MKSPVWAFLEELSQKQGITEVILNSESKIFVEKDGRFFRVSKSFQTQEIFSFCNEVADFNQKICDDSHPLFDGTLPDGSRINMVHPPLVSIPQITIRKYLKKIKRFESGQNLFGLDDNWIFLLKKMVISGMNMVISGGTGVGKTTFLNLLLQEIPPEERVITLEDTRELSFDLPNRVHIVSGNFGFGLKEIQMSDLVRNTLRMRPNRIVIGEIRGPEIFEFLQVVNSGHYGSMTSLHSNSSVECLSRIETLFALNRPDYSLKALREYMSAGIDYILQLSRNREGKRVLSEITEVSGIEGDRITTNKIAQYDEKALYSRGIVPMEFEKLVNVGLPRNFFDQLKIR